ncbi:antimicrobial peptide 1-like [Cryptomeria japonica]|uniref:antimicrobial peptide 1-like n=1 Tax=Cryptomeria japonica TaxID=3369 RepID=UPI0025AC3D69|nr:antimicrobial peptide 1-like [Cryptomeria japonica]
MNCEVMKKTSVYKYIGAFMLVWLLFGKANCSDSAIIIFQEPGCPTGGVSMVEGCGCFSVPSDYHGGFIFISQGNDIAFYTDDGCNGDPDTRFSNDEKECNPFVWRSYFIFCS